MSFGTIKRIYSSLNPTEAKKSPDALKFGILGAAAIGPMALITPAQSHPEVILYAVAARDINKAKAYAKKHGFEKTYGSYQELLDDPAVDVVYNPLPNGLHFEWTMKSLKAGKHVLLEKPAADTAEEARIMFEYAKSENLVLLEAFHYRFHPAIQRVKAIIDSGELGQLRSVSARMLMSAGFFKPDDIRLNYKLGGGGLMDMGCYVINVVRHLAGSNPKSIVSSSTIPYVAPSSPKDAKSQIDRSTKATFSFPGSVLGSIHIDLMVPAKFGIVPKMPEMALEVECENGEVELTNFPMPVLWHSINVVVREKKKEGQPEGKKGKVVSKRTEKAYTFKEAKIPYSGKEADSSTSGGVNADGGPEWWSTYRYQLEAFVNRVKGRPAQTWIEPEDTINNMQWIENVYAAIGMDSRPKSTWKLEETTAEATSNVEVAPEATPVATTEPQPTPSE